MKSKVNDLFSLKYYHASLGDEDLKLIKDSINLDPKLKNSLTEGCWVEKCSTSFPSFLNQDDFKNYTGNTVIDVKNFTEIISKHFDEYALALTKRKQDVKIKLMDAWLNKYEKGDAQEPHNHCTVGSIRCFSGCIFLSFDKEKDARFRFHNQSMINYNEPDDAFALLAEGVTCPDITQGDIILFNSSSWHSVEKQKESTNRTTLSFNFEIEGTQHSLDSRTLAKHEHEERELTDKERAVLLDKIT